MVTCIVRAERQDDLKNFLEVKAEELLMAGKKFVSTKAYRIYQKDLFGFSKFKGYEATLIYEN